MTASAYPPRYAELPDELFGESDDSFSVDVVTRQAWEAVAHTVRVVRASDAKSLGVVATRDIGVGEELFRERPLLVLKPDGAGRFDGTWGGESEMARALLATLSSAKQGQGVLGSQIETNGIVVNYNSPHAFTAVHLLLSRCNHSCKPNASFSWDAASEEGCLHATLPIPAGAAVEFNYGASGSRARRQRRLQQRFQFLCACELCSLSGAALERSDAEEEARLWGDIGATTSSDSNSEVDEVEDEADVE